MTEDLMAKLDESLTPVAQSTYTVLVEFEVESLSGTERAVGQKMKAWVEAGTYTVAPRTHRKRLVTQALKDVGLAPEPGKPAPRVRVLDEESAFVHEPEAKQPPAEWVIG